MGEGGGKGSTLRGKETVISRKTEDQFSGKIITFLLLLSFTLVFYCNIQSYGSRLRFDLEG